MEQAVAGEPSDRPAGGVQGVGSTTMSTITTKKLGNTIGAEVLGIERRQLLEDDGLPAAVMEALEENGVLVFRELDVDDDTQIAFSKKLDDVGKSEPADAPRIFIVTLDPQRTPQPSICVAPSFGTSTVHRTTCQPRPRCSAPRRSQPSAGKRSSQAPTPHTTT